MQKEKCQQKAVADARRPRLVADDVAHLNERSVNNPGRHIDASHSKPCSRIYCVGNYWQRERLSQQQRERRLRQSLRVRDGSTCRERVIRTCSGVTRVKLSCALQRQRASGWQTKGGAMATERIKQRRTKSSHKTSIHLNSMRKPPGPHDLIN